jgi:hypothetical protein
MPAVPDRATVCFRNPLRTGAIVLALGCLLPVHAQELRGWVSSVQRSEDQTERPNTRGRDTTSLRSRWRAQQIATRKAEAEYYIARFSREVAVLAALEYIEVIFPKDLASANAGIKLAESNIKRFESELERDRKTPMRWPAGVELSLKKARFALEQALSKKKVLVEYTIFKTIRELKSEIDNARSNEQAKWATWQLHKAKEADLERLVMQSQVIVAKLEAW